MPPLDQFRIGDPENPVPPATVIVQVEEFTARTKPSSPTTHRTRNALPRGLSAGFWDNWSLLCRTCPPGLIVLFTWQDFLSAIPNLPVRQ